VAEKPVGPGVDDAAEDAATKAGEDRGVADFDGEQRGAGQPSDGGEASIVFFVTETVPATCTKDEARVPPCRCFKLDAVGAVEINVRRPTATDLFEKSSTLPPEAVFSDSDRLATVAVTSGTFCSPALAIVSLVANQVFAVPSPTIRRRVGCRCAEAVAWRRR